MRYWMRSRAARAVALLFGLSMLLAACDDGSVREFLAELFPPPAEASGDDVAGEDAGDASEDPSEDGAGEGSESDDTSDNSDDSDNERCINRNEHRGSLRSPPLRDERRNNRNNDNARDRQQEPEDDGASDEPSEQEEPEGAGEASEDDDGPAERQRRRRDRAPADDNNEQEENAGGQSSGLSGIEQQVFDLLNAERQRAGLSPLRLDSTLSQGARAWSRRMATEGFFEHDTSGNFAENIAYGYPTAAAVHDGWMNSAGHRANRMNSDYTRYGVGVYEQGNTLYYTERFQP